MCFTFLISVSTAFLQTFMSFGHSEHALYIFLNGRTIKNVTQNLFQNLQKQNLYKQY